CPCRVSLPVSSTLKWAAAKPIDSLATTSVADDAQAGVVEASAGSAAGLPRPPGESSAGTRSGGSAIGGYHTEIVARETLLLIDGHALVYRAYFAMPALANTRGELTNAVFGFTS